MPQLGCVECVCVATVTVTLCVRQVLLGGRTQEQYELWYYPGNFEVCTYLPTYSRKKYSE